MIAVCIIGTPLCLLHLDLASQTFSYICQSFCNGVRIWALAVLFFKDCNKGCIVTVNDYFIIPCKVGDRCKAAHSSKPL